MKSCNVFWFAAFIMLSGLSSPAAQIQPLRQPYTQARLLEIADGHEIDPGYEKTVSFAQIGDSDMLSAIEITEERKTPCKELPCGPTFRKRDFVINKKVKGKCGSLKYEGYERNRPGTVNQTIEVFDHSNRICDDKDYQWELILKEPGHKPRLLAGDIE